MKSHDIENQLKKLRFKTSDSTRRTILRRASEVLETKTKSKPASGKSGLRRIIMNKPITKLAIAAVVLIGAITLFYSTTFVNPTFAEVIKPLFTAQTIAFDMIAGQEGQDPVIHDIVKGDIIRRTMTNLPTITMIIDIQAEKMLHLESSEKGAMYIDIKGPLQEGTRSFLKFIRDTLTRVQASPDFQAKELPKKEFDGKTLIGFLSKGPNENITIWADPRTALPVRIEMEIAHQRMLLKNFQFDIPVDDSLVSMEIPAGYKIRESSMDLNNPTEQDFVKILEFWAKVILDGQFPDAIGTQDFMKLIGPLQQKMGQEGVSQEEAMRMGESYARGMLFLQLFELHGKGTSHYAGKGVKFGDAGKAVFWYKFKEAKTWRVIYGDMSVKDVAEEDLPKQ